ncbi:MAG: 3-deoxy-7-phosphoheptulonate synthase, partial [Betaproteobacteria bacterium]
MATELRILGRHQADEHDTGFTYNGVTFSQDNLHTFAGLNAVDTREFVEQTFACLRDHGQVCARMGA